MQQQEGEVLARHDTANMDANPKIIVCFCCWHHAASVFNSEDMIQRKNQITMGASEVSFTVSYSAIDVWSWLHYMAWLLHRDDPQLYDFSLNTPKSKVDIIHFITHCPDHGLGWMPEKRALPIAEWAFDMALKKKYILPTYEKDGRQFYTFAAMLAKKNGRPRTEDWK